MSESIEWFRENQAFSPLYDLAPPHPLPCQQVDSISESSGVSPTELTEGGGGGEGGSGGGAKSSDCEKAWSSIYHSILSDKTY
jgi:hypothetical protein